MRRYGTSDDRASRGDSYLVEDRSRRLTPLWSSLLLLHSLVLLFLFWIRTRLAMLSRHGYATLAEYLNYASACFECDQRDLFFGSCCKLASGPSSATQLLNVARKAWNQLGAPVGISSAVQTAAELIARMEYGGRGAGAAGAGAAGAGAAGAGATGAGAAGAGAAGAGAAGAVAAGAGAVGVGATGAAAAGTGGAGTKAAGARRT
jgi:hypothetical protein